MIPAVGAGINGLLRRSAVLWMCGDKACNGGDDLVFRAVVAVVVERTARGEGNPSTAVNDDFGFVLVGNAL